MALSKSSPETSRRLPTDVTKPVAEMPLKAQIEAAWAQATNPVVEGIALAVESTGQSVDHRDLRPHDDRRPVDASLRFFKAKISKDSVPVMDHQVLPDGFNDVYESGSVNPDSAKSTALVYITDGDLSIGITDIKPGAELEEIWSLAKEQQKDDTERVHPFGSLNSAETDLFIS